jgi:hypothetical protein
MRYEYKKAKTKKEEKHSIIFFIMMMLHKTFYLLIGIGIYYANASPPIEQVMEKLIKLISDEQVEKRGVFFR